MKTKIYPKWFLFCVAFPALAALALLAYEHTMLAQDSKAVPSLPQEAREPAAREPNKDATLLTVTAKAINDAQAAKDKLHVKDAVDHSLKLDTTQSLVVLEQAAGEVLQVYGIAVIQLGNPSPWQGMRYARPEKPDEVKVTLTTKDGKRWVAKWVEEKP